MVPTIHVNKRSNLVIYRINIFPLLTAEKQRIKHPPHSKKYSHSNASQMLHDKNNLRIFCCYFFFLFIASYLFAPTCKVCIQPINLSLAIYLVHSIFFAYLFGFSIFFFYFFKLLLHFQVRQAHNTQ